MSGREAIKEAATVVLNRATLIPIGVAVAIGSAIVLAAFHFGGRVSALDARLASIESAQHSQAVATTALTVQMTGFREDLENIDREMTLRTSYRWTNLQMHRWARDLARENPGVKVPDVYDYHAPSVTIGSGTMLSPGRPMLPE